MVARRQETASRAASGSAAETQRPSYRLSGYPDQQLEMPELDLEQAPAGKMYYPGQQDDDKDDQDDPDNGHHETRDREAAQSSHSRNASACRAYRNDLGINVEGRNSVIATGWDVISLPAPYRKSVSSRGRGCWRQRPTARGTVRGHAALPGRAVSRNEAIQG